MLMIYVKLELINVIVRWRKFFI